MAVKYDNVGWRTESALWASTVALTAVDALLAAGQERPHCKGRLPPALLVDFRTPWFWHAIFFPCRKERWKGEQDAMDYGTTPDYVLVLKS